MRVTLEVKSGMNIGRRFDVVEGAQAVFGRSSEVTHVVEHDPHVAERHFSLVGDEQGWSLRALSDTSPTYLNGEAVECAVLAEGDVLKAGHTVFHVTDIELTHLDSSFRLGLPAGAGDAAPDAEAPAVGEDPAPAPEPKPEEDRTGPELLEWLGQDEEAQAVAKPGQTAAELLAVFAERGELPVALRLQAHLLDPRAAVWWGLLCLREVLSDGPPEDQRASWDAAMAWVVDPSEENRRIAEKAGPAGGAKGPSAFVCAGAFWSGGSLAPAGLPDVPPDARLTGQAISGVLLMAAPEGDPTKAPERHERFLRLGAEVAEGKHPFPEPGAAPQK